MTDLQLGLLVIGALAIVGVLVYNRLQERSARRGAEHAFGSRHADALLEEPVARREPTLQPPQQPPARHAARPGAEALPDARFDYLIELQLPRPVSAAGVLEGWAPLERRFAPRVLLAASAGDSDWRRLVPGDAGPCAALRAGLQLASREGPVSEASLLEFRSGVETLGAKLGATLSAPAMKPAVEEARKLDDLCAAADIQVAFHVVAPADAPFDEAQAAAAVREAPGFGIEQRRGERPGAIEALTLTLDVPRASDLARTYDAMARSGRELAAALGGTLADDNGNTLDERALGVIADQVEAVRRRLAERGIEPGSPLALRLFS